MIVDDKSSFVHSSSPINWFFLWCWGSEREPPNGEEILIVDDIPIAVNAKAFGHVGIENKGVVSCDKQAVTAAD